MRILHILSDGPADLSTRTIDAQEEGNEIKIVDLTKRDEPYEEIVDDIFSYDRVICW